MILYLRLSDGITLYSNKRQGYMYDAAIIEVIRVIFINFSHACNTFDILSVYNRLVKTTMSIVWMPPNSWTIFIDYICAELMGYFPLYIALLL